MQNESKPLTIIISALVTPTFLTCEQYLEGKVYLEPVHYLLLVLECDEAGAIESRFCQAKGIVTCLGSVIHLLGRFIMVLAIYFGLRSLKSSWVGVFITVG